MLWLMGIMFTAGFVLASDDYEELTSGDAVVNTLLLIFVWPGVLGYLVKKEIDKRYIKDPIDGYVDELRKSDK